MANTIVDVRVASSTDDAEENLGNGKVSRASSDLELTTDRSKNQLVGVRFTGLDIPPGAIIVNAHLQFTVDEVSTGAASLTINGEDSDNALTYSSANGDISSRAATNATVGWQPADWNTVGESGLDQQTPDISAIIQEIVDRGGWTSASALALTISGTGRRAAESFNGSQASAPLLHIEYLLPDTGVPVIDLDGDNSSGATANDFAATFSSQGAPVAIADIDTVVSDSDSLMLQSASVTITNWQTGDVLAAPGGLPGGIITTWDQAGILTLSGPATPTDYAAAIRLVTFEHTSGTPVLGDRSIAVVVNDGTTGSEVATATVTVLPPNTAPVAAPDSLYAVGGVARLIDAAELTGNDADANGDTLTITDVTVPAYGTAVLLNGNVTYTATPGYSGVDSFDYTISDGNGGLATATVTVSVIDAAAVLTTESRIAASTDDAEEKLSNSGVATGSSDLELSVDRSAAQLVGMRFTGLNIPTNAIIVNAYIQFTVDEASTGAVALVIGGEATDDALTFSTATGDISTRADAAATVAWAPPDWTTVGASGLEQRTPDLSSVIQEIVDRPGWTANSALALTVSGTGKRTAESFNGSQSSAPLLHVEYALPGDGVPIVDLDDNNSSGVNPTGFATVFAVQGGPVAIADTDAVVTDSDSAMLASARVTLMNPQTGDVLAAGSMPGGITATVEPDGSLTLSGAAAPSDYATAIRSVTFDNASGAPVMGDRTIEVVVNDGTTDSAAATATVTVAPINTPPVAAPDALVAVDGFARQIAATELTANDFDADGHALTITDVTNPTHGTAVVNLDGSVTYTATSGYAGADSFVYTINDGNGGTNTAIVDLDVVGLGPVVALQSQVAASSDDAEENMSGNSVSVSSSDLELAVDGSKNQLVGLRFTGLDIPTDAVIVNAYVQFTADEVRTGAMSLTITGEDADNAQTYSSAIGDISSRTSTSASAAWSPGDWNIIGESGLEQQTTDISSVIQEIVDRPGWISGDAIALMISGTGRRAAESYDGLQTGAPVLHIEYAMPKDGIPRIDLDANDSSGTAASDFTASFLVGGTPTAIADTDTLITDSDSTMLAAARIAITNPGSGDTLGFGSLPIDINAVFSDNGTILDLTGPATLADYQTAIETVTFDNPLADPVASMRIIEVTLDDGTTIGPAATTKMNVLGPGFEFTVVADSPYSANEFSTLGNILSNTPAQSEFVIHLGDITGSSGTIDPASYFPQVASTLQASPNPLFLILGDNEYNDQPNPDAAFTEWKSTFVGFDQSWAHGLGTQYQAARPENFSFVIDATLFIGLNMVGSAVHDANEWATRSADNLAWVEDMFAQNGATSANAVLFGHASPKHSGYNTFEAGFLTVAQEFQKPILWLQGDSHTWALNQQYYASTPNITRVIVDRTGSNAPLQVTVNNDPDDPFASDHDFGGLFL